MIIGIPLLGIPTLIIGWCGLYYSLQAANNLKPSSKWPKFSGMAKGSLALVSRSEFTELGLRYRHRAFVMTFALVAWLLVVLSYWLFAAWFTS
jgi:hypothetical protein